MTQTPAIDHTLVRRARDDCAADYMDVAVFQRSLDEELLERLELLRIPVTAIAVLGAGNPVAVHRLSTLYPEAQITILDISERLLLQDQAALAGLSPIAATTRQCELFSLPCKDSEFDLVYSNLFAAMTDALQQLLEDVHRVLKPGGCFHFSCLGADTFHELQAAWRAVEGTSIAHVGTMPDMHDTGDALVRAHFSEPVMDCDKVTMTYSSVAAMLTDLRANGVRNCLVGRFTGLTGKARWRSFCSALHELKIDGRYVLTLESVLGQAWKPDTPVQRRFEDGSVGVPIAHLRPGQGL